MYARGVVMKSEGTGVSTIANLGSLFDIAGVAVDAFTDHVTLESRREPGVHLEIVGAESGNVAAGERNLAVMTLRLALDHCPLEEEPPGWRILLEKNVPVGRGMGSSAATVAAVLRAYWALGPRCGLETLASIAGRAEGLVSGSVHYDNVLPSLMGGLVVMGGLDQEPPHFHVHTWPPGLAFVLLVPGAGEVDREEKTKRMRQALPQEYSFREMVVYQSYGALLLSSLATRDHRALGKAVSYGGVVEKVRSRWIPGYWEIKEEALKAGALGFNISGAGPTMFALVEEGWRDPVVGVFEKMAPRYYGEYRVVEARAIPPYSDW